jgi:hypothetical protein
MGLEDVISIAFASSVGITTSLYIGARIFAEDCEPSGATVAGEARR